MADSALPKSRLEALTDGIFSVAMTLLVLDLHFPEPSAGSIFDDAMRLLDRFDNYVISFVALAVFWLGHVRMLARMRGTDVGFVVGNLAFLLFTTLVPPLTALLGEHPDAPRAAVLYGANLVAILACEMALWRAVCHRLAHEVPDMDTWAIMRRRYALSIAVVVGGIVIALIEIRMGASQGFAAWVYLLLIGLGLIRPPLRERGQK